MEKGSFERTFFVRLTWPELNMLRWGMKHHDKRHPGRAGFKSRITEKGWRLLETLCTFAIVSPVGRVDPTYEYLAAETGMSRDSVWRYLDRLEGAGLLERQKRVKPTGDPLRPWEQTSNAYRILRPAWIVAMLPLALKPAPVLSADLEHARAKATESALAMVEELPDREWGAFTFADASAAADGARLRRSLREFEDLTERRRYIAPPLGNIGVVLTDDSSARGAPTAPESAAGRRTAGSGPPPRRP